MCERHTRTLAAVCAEAGGPEKDARAGEEAPDDEGELVDDGASRVQKGGESVREAAGSSEEEEKDEEGEDEGENEGEGEEEVKKKGEDAAVESALLLSSCSRSSNSLSRSNASSTSSWSVFLRRGQQLARGE